MAQATSAEDNFWNLKEIVFEMLAVVFFSVFIAFLQPFGMNDVHRLYGALFWLAMCTTGYCIYKPVIYYGSQWLERRLPSSQYRAFLSQFLSILAASVVMAFVSPLVTELFFNFGDDYWQTLPLSFVSSLFIGGIITVFSSLILLASKLKNQIQTTNDALTSESQALQQTLAQPADDFINELPLEKRGNLICLAMEDHYIRVVTDKGEHLLLMRFKDALNALTHYPGFQTHRSWWVAKDAVLSTKKDGRKLVLVLDNQMEVPVSQTFLASIKDELKL